MSVILQESRFQHEASEMHLIGQYLMAAQHITPSQITAAVRQAYQLRTRVGMVLLQKGLVSPIALSDALVSQSLDRLMAGLPMRYIGERLLAHGSITPDQLAAALYSQLVRAQQGSTTPLGQLLVGQGVLDSEQLRATLAVPVNSAAPGSFLQGRVTVPVASDTAIVLEDDSLFARIITTIINQTTGLRTHTLTQVTGAQEILRHALPRLIVTDRRFSDGDGLMLAARVRAYSDSVAIVLLTADTSPALTSLIRAARIHQYVAKPFDVSTLITAVKNALQETAPLPSLP
ncbi:MAG: response regulator [Blastochloris sp.]|nr:response regulator [Blastochloris sp.]